MITHGYFNVQLFIYPFANQKYVYQNFIRVGISESNRLIKPTTCIFLSVLKYLEYPER